MKWIDREWFVDDYNRAIRFSEVNFVIAHEVEQNGNTLYRMTIKNPEDLNHLWYISKISYKSEKSVMEDWLKFYNERPKEKTEIIEHKNNLI